MLVLAPTFKSPELRHYYISTLSVFWVFHFIAVPPSGNLIAFLFLLKPAAFLLPEAEIVITLKQIVTLIKEMSMLFF